jgi:transcriptional regulator with XRE-family HTH domain
MSMAKPSPTYAGSKELKAIGAAIRKMRKDQGYSQEAFADEVGLDRSYMGGIERGEHNLALMNLLKISKALKLPLSQLFICVKL